MINEPHFQIDRFKQERKKRGYTLRKLADKATVRYATIADWEAGRNMPSALALALVARTLGVSMDYLMGLSEYEQWI